MENITIGQIVAGIGIITVIVGFFISIFKFYKSNFTDKFFKIEKRLDVLEQNDKNQDADIKESKEERLILLKAQLACLKGLKEQGCNGPVTQEITNIENYLINKSHE